MDNWFDGILSEGQAMPVHSLESGYKSEMVQKWVQRKSLPSKGFRTLYPLYPLYPPKNSHPERVRKTPPETGQPFTAVPTGQPTPVPALPADLLERANLEQWPAADRVEWLGILRRQLEQDGTPVRGLVACLDTHLAKHHAGMVGNDDREAIEERAAIMECDGGLLRAEAERLASQVNGLHDLPLLAGCAALPKPAPQGSEWPRARPRAQEPAGGRLRQTPAALAGVQRSRRCELQPLAPGRAVRVQQGSGLGACSMTADKPTKPAAGLVLQADETSPQG